MIPLSKARKRDSSDPWESGPVDIPVSYMYVRNMDEDITPGIVTIPAFRRDQATTDPGVCASHLPVLPAVGCIVTTTWWSGPQKAEPAAERIGTVTSMTANPGANTTATKIEFEGMQGVMNCDHL